MTACLPTTLSVADLRLLLREYHIRFSCDCEMCDSRGFVEYAGITGLSAEDCSECGGAGKTGSVEMLTAFLAADGDAWLQSQALLADPSVTSDNLLDRRMWLADRIAEMEGGARCR